MKVLLNADIVNLGEEGDILEVSPGYARNYLLPKKLVSMHNKANLAVLESKRKTIEKRKEEKRAQMLTVKKRIQDCTLILHMPAGDKGKLFGSVTSQMIVDALAKLDITIERKKIDIPSHTLKVLGKHSVQVRLYDNEAIDLSVQVLGEGETALPPAPTAAETPATPPPTQPENNSTPSADSDTPTTPSTDSDTPTTPSTDSDTPTTPSADSDTPTTPSADSDTPAEENAGAGSAR